MKDADVRQSAALDHLRWTAAVAVLLQHARGFLMVEYYPTASAPTKIFYFMTGFGHSAVIVFFVLSGYLVGGKALRIMTDGSTPERRNRFVVDRFARIFTVLWPALLLTALAALISPHTPVLDRRDWAGPGPRVLDHVDLVSWLGTAMMLNETVFATVGLNSPLWSLAYEWTYYVVAAGLLVAAARDWSVPGLMVVLYAAGLIVLSIAFQPVILLLSFCWALGALATRLPSVVPFWLSLPLLAASLVFARLTDQTLLTELAVAAATGLLLATRGFMQWRMLPRLGGWLAGFSFSLYAVHIPVLLLAVSLMQRQGLFLERQAAGVTAFAAVAFLVALGLTVAYLFSLVTERRTDRIRSWLLHRGGRAVTAPARAPAPPPAG